MTDLDESSQKSPVKPAGKRRHLTGWQKARLTAAITIAIAAGVCAVATYVPGGPRVCREQPAQVASGPSGVITLCGPVGPEDLPMVGLVLLLIGLILLPDLSELGVAGLTVKPRSEDEPVLPPSLASEGGKPSPASEAVAAAVSASTGMSGSLSIRRISQERADLEAQLTRAWTEIERYLAQERTAVADIHPGTAGTSQRALRADALTNWAIRFAEPINVVRLARNTVVHRPENLTDAEVAEAVRVAHGVLGSLEENLLKGEVTPTQSSSSSDIPQP